MGSLEMVVLSQFGATVVFLSAIAVMFKIKEAAILAVAASVWAVLIAAQIAIGLF